ncbi:DUF1328 domain-containing protein [Halapricum sp. CBA1109]|uniref:DUF1328 domain-containing protein n=1 Tax=Halapricum sp. CBA1109 TaxID=2668068 RepID=UPI0012FC8050|nr:DUF1328 domain-containing protein [Halapricum sp. CBA1109]MUV89134.1 DUF1328 domain-containing protein [Halapricum sp. CBA1109]
MDITPIAASDSHWVSSVLGDPIPLQFSGDFLGLAIIFFVVAVIAAIVGARGVAGISMTVAKWAVIIFLALAVISILV